MQLFDGFKTYISDIIDILIVSYIIYQLLVLLRGTRGVQLLKGVSVVIIAWSISYFLQLTTLRWLIENLFSVGLIAIIVIFQPELRRALEQLGRGGFFQFNRQMKDEQTGRIADEISKAALILSEKQIGALIAIERQTGLSDYIETGVRLESKLSSELFQQLFITSGPLHDGAVVVREDLIMAAGCYLPLSENRLISKELGTRHRAGIGLSEHSDALVVIVSEETGAISLAQHGKLQRDLSEDSLLQQLYNGLRPRERRKFVTWRQPKIHEGEGGE
ncbi:diadenylate cyclase [Seinonella peptonophila]|uniref:Diadenylate cyclase n=1 Tax=Seinonella peptonophila TaxID=112248 RepID=A0A1M4YF03_9BACL|nr:diadenylate cyclase CdaA [Seinonella peptonophila]SHF04062.1 diadenylate cyclase [Seinonella peptonophila]